MFVNPGSNVIYGCITVLLAGVLCFVSWKYTRAGKWHQALALLAVCGLLLRVFISLDQGLHDWDEQYHALVAKHLITHPLKPVLYEQPVLPYDYRNWNENHIWLHKQPLSLWLMAVGIRWFGLHAFSVRLPSLLLSVLLIILVYGIGQRLFSRRIGYIAAFLCAIHGFLLDLVAGRAATDHVDADFLFWITLGVWLAMRQAARPSRRMLLLTGAAMGAGILTKWLPALIIVPLWVIAQHHYRKISWKKCAGELLIVLAAAAAVALPWQLYILRNYPAEARWEYSYNAMHLRKAVEGHLGTFFYHFDNLRIRFGEIVYLPVMLFTWQAFKQRRPALTLISVWFWAIYMFFSFAATKMDAYPMIAAPAVWIMTAWTFQRLSGVKVSARYTTWLKYTGMALLIALPVRYCIERLKPFGPMDRRRHYLVALSGNYGHNVVLMNAAFPIEEMFFGKVTAYERSIDSMTAKQLRSDGWIVVDAGTAASGFR